MGEPAAGGEEDAYWGRLCQSMASRCLECSSLGMRGDPMGVLRISSSSHQFYESDSTPDSPRLSTINATISSHFSGNLSADSNGLESGAVRENQGNGNEEAPSPPRPPPPPPPPPPPLRRFSLEILREWAMKRSHWQQVASDPMLFPRIALMVMLVLLVTILTVSAWYVASSQIRRSIAPLVASLRTEAAFDIEKPLDFALNYTSTSVSLLSRLLSASNASLTSSPPQLKSLLWTGYFMRPGSSAAGFFTRDLSFMAFADSNSSRSDDAYFFSSTGNSKSTHRKSCVSPDSFRWFRQLVHPVTGKVEQAQTPSPCLFYTARSSLYQAALNDTSGKIFWDITADSSGSLSLLGMQAVRSSSRTSGVAFVTRSFENMMRQVDAFQQHMFLMTDDGRLVGIYGSSYAVGDVDRANFTIPLARDSSDALVARISSFLDRVNSSLTSSPRHFENVLVDGVHYHVNTVPLSSIGQNLVAVLIISVRSLEIGLDARLHTLGMIFLGIALATVLMGCCLVVMLTKGVSISMRVEQSYIAQVKATKLAEKRSNHKKLFFANMSHDLRTPLAAIIGLIDLCLSYKERLSVELESNMLQMKTCATTLLGILNSILDMSKAEVGKLELEVADFDLIKVLEEAVDIFAVVGAKKGIEVVLELPDDSIELVRWVRGDAGRVKQLLCDLLSNGVKFTSRGYVILRAFPKQSSSQSWVASASRRSGRWFQKTFVSCLRTSGSSSSRSSQIPARSQGSSSDTLEFEFEVDDTGQGIPQSRREAVFRNFVQGSSKVHCTYGGTGLGLAIVRSLVHMMGGQIKVANKDGPGTLFKFNLLFQKASSRDIQTTHSGLRRNGSHQQSFGEESQLLENAARVDGLEGQNLQVVLAMAGELGRKFVSLWMQNKGAAQVCEVSQWQSIIPSLERALADRTSVCSADSSLDITTESNARSSPSPRGRSVLCLAMLDTALFPEGNASITTKFRMELDELVRSSRGSGKCVHISWIFSADTTNLVWQTLHSRSDLIVHKPVHSSRLAALVEELQGQHFEHLVAEQQRWSNAKRPSCEKRSSFSSRSRSGSAQELSRLSLDQHQQQRGLAEERRRSDGDVDESEDGDTGKGRSGSLAELRILVVEDTVLLQKVTKAMLEREGAIVELAANGEEAVSSIAASLADDPWSPDPVQQKRRMDLVLMDCQMPVMDGYAATARIRELEGGSSSKASENSGSACRVPIIALTAHAMASDEQKCKGVGMDAYLTKPLNLEELTKTMKGLGILS
ncbi:histidine kinase 1 [Selaginella moellendorffii]|uniref:histidine kinase 1 n=1 Tax=Selaginella moellendorffii TaxID=88036 RepID=UPI000D1C5672|nr:histidine kinase 1 [Selaginella moellendorffii]|eukprot:XP_024540565.1 histidine kinase 1 [Selaginella moellendorffii]